MVGNDLSAELVGLACELSGGVEIAKEHTGLANGQYRCRNTTLIHIVDRLCHGPFHQGHLASSPTGDFSNEPRSREMVVNVDAKRLVDGCFRTCRLIREQGPCARCRETAKKCPPRAAHRSRMEMVCALADKCFRLAARCQFHDVLPVLSYPGIPMMRPRISGDDGSNLGVRAP